METDNLHQVFWPRYLSEGSETKQVQQVTQESENIFNDLENRCRCCFERFTISSIKIGFKATQRNMLSQLIGIEIIQEQGYPNFMCLQCITDIKKCREFIDKAKKLQEKFCEFVSPKEIEGYCIKTEFTFQEPAVVIDELHSTDVSLVKKCSVKLERINLERYEVDMSYYDSNFNDDDDDFFDANFDHSFGIDDISNCSSSRSSTPEQKQIPKKKKLRCITFNHLPLDQRTYCCDKCDFKTPIRQKIIFHVGTHLNTSRVESLCNHCGKSYTTADGLKTHIRKVHTDAKVDAATCWFCNIECESHHLLIRHLEWYHPNEERKFQCEKCTESFFTEASLTRHVQLVHDVKVKCKDKNCDKMFHDVRLMNRHYLKCHKERTDVSIKFLKSDG